MALRVYLDTCVWLRPYDDQRQRRIRVEAGWVGEVFGLSRRGVLDLVASELVVLEIDEAPPWKRDGRRFLSLCREVLPVMPEDAHLAAEVSRECGTSGMDSMHVAVAARAGKVFLTCDDKLRERSMKADRLFRKRGLGLQTSSLEEFVEEWRAK